MLVSRPPEAAMPDSPAFACRFHFTPDNSAVVIALSGRLDPDAVQELHPQIQEVYRAGVRRFVFDLSQLQHAGSLGLRLFLALHNQVKGEGGVALCRPAPPVASLLEMMKLHEVLPVHDTHDEALAATGTVG
jgi:anti-anti-sigma factor